MRNERIRWLLLTVGCLALGAATATAIAKSKKEPPKTKLMINGCQKTKSPVTFPHPTHVKNVDPKQNNCQVCHHLIKGKEPPQYKCTGCHNKPQGKLGTCQDKSTKKNPFHVLCLGCHKKLKKTQPNFKGPTKCKLCHPTK